MNDFPTWRDEYKIMRKGRMICVAVFSGVLVFVLVFCYLRFEFSKFWLVRISNGITLNVPYASLVFIMVFLIYSHIEPFFLVVRRYTIVCKRLPLTGLRIAHVSDTHVHFPYPHVTTKRLIKIAQKINNEHPDIVVVTGDLMSDGSKYEYRDIATIREGFRHIQAPLYVCFGNHDVDCHQSLITALQGIGATTLEQATVEVYVRGKRIYLSGLKPSLVLVETNEYVDELKCKFHGDTSAFHILLAHMPDTADAAAATGLFDLQLSGHSHGGQCVLPFQGGTPLLPPGCLRYHACVTSNYQVNDMVLHISRGVGVTPLPFPLIRFLCPPEISILTLVPVEPHDSIGYF